MAIGCVNGEYKNSKDAQPFQNGSYVGRKIWCNLKNHECVLQYGCAYYEKPKTDHAKYALYVAI
jgi:hypothetical protein